MRKGKGEGMHGSHQTSPSIFYPLFMSLICHYLAGRITECSILLRGQNCHDCQLFSIEIGNHLPVAAPRGEFPLKVQWGPSSGHDCGTGWGGLPPPPCHFANPKQLQGVICPTRKLCMHWCLYLPLPDGTNNTLLVPFCVRKMVGCGRQKPLLPPHHSPD